MPGAPNPIYDANGNILSIADAVTHNYLWDSEGKQVSVDAINGTYDALGRLVELNNLSAYTQVVYGVAGEKFALMNGQSLQKALVAMPAGTAVYTQSGLSFRHLDWLGSSRLVTTTSQTVASSMAYAPYGEPYSGSGNSDYSFTGQDMDTTGASQSGLYDFLYRRLSSTEGRWLSPDPAGIAAVNPSNPQTWNRYAYVGNTPLTVIDPLGLCDDIMECWAPVLWHYLIANDGPGSGGGEVYADMSMLGCSAEYSFRDCGGWAGIYGGYYGDSYAQLKKECEGLSPDACESLLKYDAQVAKAFVSDPCIYLNNAGTGVEWVDHNSSPAECNKTGGQWIDPQPPGTTYGVLDGKAYPIVPSSWGWCSSLEAAGRTTQVIAAGVFVYGTILTATGVGAPVGVLSQGSAAIGGAVGTIANYAGWFGKTQGWCH